jgi:hypothetical protein
MRTSYAVKWSEPGGGVYTGRLELLPKAFLLEGRNGSGPVTRQIDYEELRGLHLGRAGEQRLNGQPTLVIERPDGHYLVASVAMQAGILQEIIHRLAELKLTAPKRATVVVSLKEGATDQVRPLVAQGPPLDLATAAFTHHQLLLTDREAIFVFETLNEGDLDTLLSQVDVWTAAWRELIDGPPRLAEMAYSWERTHSLEPINL